MSRKKIGEVASIYRGVSYKKNQASKIKQNNQIALIRANNISAGRFILNDLLFVPKDLVSEQQIVHRDDIVITMSSGSKSHVGKVAIAKDELQCAFGAFCAKISSFAINPMYLFYILSSNSFRNHIENQCKGTNINNIKQSYILDYEIEVPSINEQEKIVSQIEESLSQLDSAVETLKKTKQQLEVYRQAVIENAISDGKTNSANSVPFGDLVLRYQNGISKRSGKGIETPVLRLADIDNQQIVAGKGFRYIGLTDIERSRFLLNAGDLLIIRVNGSENNVGRSIVVQEDKRYTACDHFIRCQVDRDRVLPEYAQLLLDSYPSRKHIKDNMVSTAGQNTVSQSTMSNIPVYVPSVELQKSILLQVNERLSNCEFIQNTIEESLSQAEALRQSILKQAFER